MMIGGGDTKAGFVRVGFDIPALSLCEFLRGPAHERQFHAPAVAATANANPRRRAEEGLHPRWPGRVAEPLVKMKER